MCVHVPALLVFSRADVLLDFHRCSWFPALDLIKFATRAGVTKWNERRGTAPGMAKKKTEKELTLSRTQSRHESLYSNRVSFIVRVLLIFRRRVQMLTRRLFLPFNRSAPSAQSDSATSTSRSHRTSCSASRRTRLVRPVPLSRVTRVALNKRALALFSLSPPPSSLYVHNNPPTTHPNPRSPSLAFLRSLSLSLF